MIKNFLKVKLNDEVITKDRLINGMSELQTKKNIISYVLVLDKSRLIIRDNER